MLAPTSMEKFGHSATAITLWMGAKSGRVVGRERVAKADRREKGERVFSPSVPTRKATNLAISVAEMYLREGNPKSSPRH